VRRRRKNLSGVARESTFARRAAFFLPHFEDLLRGAVLAV
jgi:hypothetical protein